MVRRLLVVFLVFSVLSVNAMAASNPIILQTSGPVGSVLNLVSSLGGGTLLDQVPGTNIYLLDLPNLPIVTPLLQWLLGIVFMEPDRTILNPARGQAGLLTAGSTGADWYKMQPEMQRIHAMSAQSYSTGKGIVVADLNTAVDYGHPALVGHLTGGYDFVSARSGYQGTLNQSGAGFIDQSGAGFIDQSGAGFIDQSGAGFIDQSGAGFIDTSAWTSLDSNPAYGHATLCAGVIAAMAPGSLIMPLRVFDDNGQTDVFSITKALYYAVGHGARVINLSFGMSQSYNSVQSALSKASSAGVVVVASAGNDDTGTPQFPASVSGVISVASVNSDNTKAAFSNYGSTVYVDAPGVNIISAYPDGRYAMVSGTSFSAPMVSAEAAMILAAKTVNVKTDIGSATVSVNGQNPQYLGKLGHGQIDVLSAVK